MDFSSLLAILLLISPMVPGLGYEAKGARIWIGLGPFNFQPGEVAKVLLVIAFSGYLVLHRDALALAGRRVLLDPEGETHRHYGATAEALYLVRPDGYVGLRAQPESEEVLVRYSARVFDRVDADAPQPGSAAPTGSSR